MTLLKKLDSRLPRLLLALLISVALLSVFAERALYRTSIEAVINAPRVDIVAPIDGIVDSVGVLQGSAVVGGHVAVRVRRDAWTASGDTPLASKSAFLEDRADIVGREIATLVALEDSLKRRETRYRRTLIAQLTADLQAARARAAEQRLVMEQIASLLQVEGSTKLDVARATSALAAAEADVTRLAVTLASAKDGVVSDDGGQDVPYSRQRLDQLTIDIARLRSERDVLKAESGSLNVGVLNVAGDSAGNVSVTAPISGIAWSVNATAGARVLKGATLATLVDCGRVYLEATVTPRDGDRIDVNKFVVVRFAGSTLESRGTVRMVQGGGVRAEGQAAAELTQNNRRGDTRVIIDLDASTIEQSSANFCQIGRNAKVFFDENAGWRPLQALSLLMR